MEFDFDDYGTKLMADSLRKCLVETEKETKRCTEDIMKICKKYMKDNKQGTSNEYLLSVNEASAEFGIGQHKLRGMIKDNPNANYVIWIGTHAKIKRDLFQNYINECNVI